MRKDGAFLLAFIESRCPYDPPYNRCDTLDGHDCRRCWINWVKSECGFINETSSETIDILKWLLDARETMICNTYSDEKVREHARKYSSVKLELTPSVFRAIETAIKVLSNESGQSDTA